MQGGMRGQTAGLVTGGFHCHCEEHSDATVSVRYWTEIAASLRS
jgi:hypothetical protein